MISITRRFVATLAFPVTCLLVGMALSARKPNVIFVLADDLGWAELGCYGNTFHETPHLDKLAKQGLRFTHAYAAASVCSPYRAAFLTGQHPARVGILDYLRSNSSNALPVSHVTLPKILRRNGYATGMIGKWHLTGYKHHDAKFEIRPTDHGFDWNTGSEVKGVGNGANFWPYVFRTQPIRWLDLPKNRLGDNEYLTDRLNLEAVEFVERNKDKPFFLYLSHYAPHTILNGRPDLVDKYRKKHKPGPSERDKCYLCQDGELKGDAGNHWASHHNPHLAAMLETIDDGIGMLDKKLDELGLVDDTIFIFSSDNGGETKVTSNAPLRGGKSQLYEGGIRVPLIVRWPKGKVPAGKTCAQPVVNHDFYPTLLEAAGIQPDPAQTLDGVSTLATWKNPKAAPKRKAIHWHYPLDKPHFLGGVSGGAIRQGNWKLIEFFDPARPARFELFDLSKDPSEKNDLAAAQPKRVRELQAKLAAWRERTGALIPSQPLLAMPKHLQFGEHFSEGQVSENWWFQKEWQVEDGILLRNEMAGENKRLFYKEPNFKDALIRFDFRFDGAKDIRLVTGASGHYNTVLHLRPDHFYLQTAKDDRGPWFPMRHGECAYDFEAGKWYNMTIEFIGDQVLAHLDHEHMVYAKHPIIDQERTYFAFQVDQAGASFDNLQVFGASRHPDRVANLARIERAKNRFPVTKALADEHEIRKRNLHALFHRKDPAYRKLVEEVDRLDAEKVERYPEFFSSHKAFKKKIQKLRKKFHQEDPVYKETLFATFRANRALDEYLVEKQPSIDKEPSTRRKAALERVRKRHQGDPAYRKLVAVAEAAQKKLEANYPQLFVSDETIHQKRNDARNALKKDEAFKKLVESRATAYRAQQGYLYENDEKL
ncbi:MAG: sulfatase-like hydrolase/transferase, partial [Opitutales bacterium]